MACIFAFSRPLKHNNLQKHLSSLFIFRFLQVRTPRFRLSFFQKQSFGLHFTLREPALLFLDHSKLAYFCEQGNNVFTCLSLVNFIGIGESLYQIIHLKLALCHAFPHHSRSFIKRKEIGKIHVFQFSGHNYALTRKSFQLKTSV